MAQYFTDYSPNPVGGIDNYPTITQWTPRVWYTTSGWSITLNDGGPSRYLLVSASGARKAATYNEVPDVADVDLYAKIRVNSDAQAKSAFLCARLDRAKNLSNNDSSTHFYYAGVSEDTLYINKYVDGAFGSISTLGITALSLTKAFCIRFSVVGSSLSLKVWEADITEPAGWDLVGTDTSIPEAGAVGIVMNAFSPAESLRHLEYGVGTGGNPAPKATVPAQFAELRYAQTKTEFRTSSTSIVVPIDARVQAGDLLLIPYYARADISAPAGYTKTGEVIGGFVNQRTGLMWKIADGSEAGTSLTLTQASAARMEALVLGYKTAATLEFANSDSSLGTSFSAALEQTTASRALSIVFAVNGYANSNSFPFSQHYSSDDEYLAVNTDTHSTTDSNRLQVYQGVFSAADTQNIQLDTSGTRNWIAIMVNFTEIAGVLTPALSLVFANSITATSAVPNVTVTF